jgi:hypothetical protein
MNTMQSEQGEIHCLLCGRYLADIRTTSEGQSRLRRALVKLVGGRLHCARCGGRAFVEWDLTASVRAA